MDATHLHLLVNHLPIVGTFLALPLLVVALFWRRQPAVLGAAVMVLVLAAGGAVVANLSGEPAEERVDDLPGVSERLIHEHEERAETATVASVVTGLAGLGLLGWAIRRRETAPLAIGALLVLSTIAAGTMAWTGAAGGQIRHTEIRDPANAAPGGSGALSIREGGDDDEQEEDD